MADDDEKPLTGREVGQQSRPASTSVFDHYRSLTEPNLMIIVEKDVVPPFRFQAGGWELLQSPDELGSTIKARIAEKGYFMFRIKEDQAGWTELIDVPSRPQ
jgi:hypothetical protein